MTEQISLRTLALGLQTIGVSDLKKLAQGKTKSLPHELHRSNDFWNKIINNLKI